MQWNEVDEFLREEATADLEEAGDIRPSLVAFRGEEPLFVAFLRSFEKGRYADPIIELLALAGPLGADRLALSVGGRAWSLEDPIAPVLHGVGDLRQRVLCTISVDGAGGAITSEGSVHPFTLTADGAVRWEPAVRSAAAETWIRGALELAVERRASLRASERDIRRQARRCAALGHLIAFADGVAQELGLSDYPATG